MSTVPLRCKKEGLETGMEDFVLLGGFAAIAIFGYYIMAKLDNFLDKVRQENEE